MECGIDWSQTLLKVLSVLSMSVILWLPMCFFIFPKCDMPHWYAKLTAFLKLTYAHAQRTLINPVLSFLTWWTDRAKQRSRSAASQDSIVIHVLGLIVCYCSSIFNSEEELYAPLGSRFPFQYPVKGSSNLGRGMIVLTLTGHRSPGIRASRPCRDRPTWGSDRLDRALDPAAAFNENHEITGFLQPLKWQSIFDV